MPKDPKGLEQRVADLEARCDAIEAKLSTIAYDADHIGAEQKEPIADV